MDASADGALDTAVAGAPPPTSTVGTPTAGAVSEKMVGVYLVGPEKVAVLPVEQANAMVGIAKTIEDQSGTIRQAERLAALLDFTQRLRDALQTASSSAVRLAVSPAEADIATFLLRQTLSRTELAWRLKHICTTCGLVQLSNPSYDKLMKRRQTLLNVTRSVGLVIMPGHVAPMLMVNSLLGFAKINPDYVCGRCKGMEADESVVVFCPTCKAQCDQAVLKTCKRCGYDFLKAADLGEMWRTLDTVAMPAASGTKLSEFVLPEEPTALAFLPNGRLLTASKDRSIECWEVGDADTPPSRVWTTALPGVIAKPLIAPNRPGTLLAVARNHAGWVSLLDAKDGVEVIRYPSRGGVVGIAFRPGDEQLAISGSYVDVVNPSGQRLLSFAMGMMGAPTHVVYSPDGRLAAVDSWMSIFVFDANSGTRLNKIGLGASTGALVWSARPEMVGAALGATVRLIEVKSGTTIAQVALDARVADIAFSRDGRYLAAASDDRSARVYDLDTLAEVARISRPHPVTAVAFAPDGRLAIGDESHTVQFWSPPQVTDATRAESVGGPPVTQAALPAAPPIPTQPVPVSVPPPSAPAPPPPVPAPTAPTPTPSPGPTPPPLAQPGWFADPWGQARLRWWDGNAWTAHLAG
jgi:hypothetical protein